MWRPPAGLRRSFTRGAGDVPPKRLRRSTAGCRARWWTEPDGSAKSSRFGSCSRAEGDRYDSFACGRVRLPGSSDRGRGEEAPPHPDNGKEFRGAFVPWCRRRGIRLRRGDVGKHGSICVTERFIRSLKSECTRRTLVPFRLTEMRRELALYCAWYNEHRPHMWLGGRTPEEVYRCVPPAADSPRFEPRPRWPRGVGRRKGQAGVHLACRSTPRESAPPPARRAPTRCLSRPSISSWSHFSDLEVRPHVRQLVEKPPEIARKGSSRSLDHYRRG
jgi:hypothetical protein